MRRRNQGDKGEEVTSVASAQDRKGRRAAAANALKKRQRWFDDDELVVVVALSIGLTAIVLGLVFGFAYFHFEGAWRPVIHSGDAPQYEACDRLSRVPSTSEWRSKYVEARRPAVLVGAAAHWPSVKTWDLHHLRERFGNTLATVNTSPNSRFDGVEGDGSMVYAASTQMRFSAFVDKLSDVIAGGSGERVYLSEISGKDYAMRCNTTTRSCSAQSGKPQYLEPMLKDGVTLPEWYPRDMGQPFIEEPLRPFSKMIFWITAGSGVTARAHFDRPHNFYAIIAGTKTFYLAAPEHSGGLYYSYRAAYRWQLNDRGEFYKSRMHRVFTGVFSPVDLSKPDFAKHPKVRSVRLLKCDLSAGDVLYMPPEYWHQVHSEPNAEGVSIALNFWQIPHLGVELNQVMSPMRMALRKMFSSQMFVLWSEVLLDGARWIGLAR